MSISQQRLPTLDALRGIAVLGVCWFHFTNGEPTFLPDGFLKSSGAYGWLGVEIFFVISGFIIPWSLRRGSYQVADYGRFLLKRMIRLEPPYLVGIGVVLAVNFIASEFLEYRGLPQFSFVQLVLHLAYLNVFFGYPWIDPPYWTLAIEFQYYLLMGLVFPAIAHRSVVVRASTFGSLALLAYSVSERQFVFHWLFLFMLGVAAFQLRADLIKRRQYYLWAGLLGAGAWHLQGHLFAIVGVSTSLLLGLCDANIKRPFLWLGRISYSLYLLHGPVGMSIIALGQTSAPANSGGQAGCGTLAAALVASVAAAWLLHKFVECPARQWSANICYVKQTASREVDSKTIR